MNGRVTQRMRGHLLLVLAACLLAEPMANADDVVQDDLIVQGSACVGLDCVNDEDFGLDTIRLKANNLRIRFEDTSIAGGFATNDWGIAANDAGIDGLNFFSIDDVTGSTTPLKIEAGAPSHSLYINEHGRLGLGTIQPEMDIHSQSGDSPALRLEQDASLGWSPQIWDVVGNEANFFIRDFTNGRKLPFRIRPGAPTSAIDIAADGDIGMGTENPAKDLHIKSAAPDEPITVRLEPATRDFWDIAADANGLTIARNDVVSMTLNNEGDLTIAGDVNVSSDLRLKTAIESISAAMDIIGLLDGKMYEWQDGRGGGSTKLGFVAQEVETVLPGLVSESQSGTKSVNYLGVIPVLVNALKEQRAAWDIQQREIQHLSEELAAQRALIQALSDLQ